MAKKPVRKKTVQKKTGKTKTTQKKIVKKTPGKPVRKKAVKKESQREKLEKELKGLLKKIDAEGLIFLLKQARVMIHNVQVDKINREIVEYESKRKTKTGGKSIKPTKSRAAAVEIEEINQGKSFFIRLNNARKIFNLDEMRSLVSICHGADDEIQAGMRIYRWLKSNRIDVLSDCNIAGNGDPHLAVLYKMIISKYKTKE
ncbi:MAG: hypothetical protein JXB88_14340 [Spirochaetales bacterium]|nr:hypothetical protein [Spirochaetales bacterium]